jgi:hypothetical protein
MKKLLILLVLLLTACAPQQSTYRLAMIEPMKMTATSDNPSEGDNKFIDKVLEKMQLFQPVEWEYYVIDGQVDQPAIPKHYESELSKQAYQVRSNGYNQHDKIGQIVFVKDNSMVYVQYWLDGIDPLVVVIYKEVDISEK